LKEEAKANQIIQTTMYTYKIGAYYNITFPSTLKITMKLEHVHHVNERHQVKFTFIDEQNNRVKFTLGMIENNRLEFVELYNDYSNEDNEDNEDNEGNEDLGVFYESKDELINDLPTIIRMAYS